MKKKNLDNEENKKNIDMKEVQTAINMGEKYINVLDKNIKKEAVILIGQTGVGKSSITAQQYGIIFQSRDKNKEKKTGELILDVSRHSNVQLPENFLIENKSQSGTEIPNILKDSEKDIYFIDMPGFDDSKGITQQVINGYYIYRSFQIHRQIKILFVFTHSALYDSGATIFIRSVENISLSLKDTDYRKCLGVIVTQVQPHITITNIVNAIKNNLLAAKQIKMSDQARNFFEYIADNPNLIIIMKKPIEESENVSEYYKPFKQDVYSLINNLKSLITPKIFTAVSEEAKAALNQFIQEIKQQTKKAIIKIVDDIQQFLLYQFMLNFSFNEQYNEDSNEKQFKQLKDCKDFLNKMQKLIENNLPSNNLQVINQIIDIYKDFNLKEQNIDELKNNIITMEYLNTIVENINVRSNIEELIKNLKQKVQDCNQQYDRELNVVLKKVNLCAIDQFIQLALELKRCEYYKNWSDQTSKFFQFINGIQKKNSFEEIYIYLQQNQEQFKFDMICLDQLYELNQLLITNKINDNLNNILPDLKNKLKDSQLSEIRLLQKELKNENNNEEKIQTLQQQNNKLNEELINNENTSKLHQEKKKILLEKQKLVDNLQIQFQSLEQEQKKSGPCLIF